jgi:pilus assembly protein Flp/PilA
MITSLVQLLAARRAEQGQTMVEYGLILALVSVVAIAILTTMGGNVVNTFTSAANAL